jgi:1-acyl-sn-glycerol-3-phosphate acyltransferase
VQIEVKTTPFTATSGKLAKEANGSIVWFIFFLVSIAVVGFFHAYVLAIPLCLLGKFWAPLTRAGGKALAFGVKLLMDIQPWFNANIQLSTKREAGGVLTISNHRSHLDMFILLSRIPNLRAVTKGELFRVPFLGVMLRVMRMIPVVRGDMESYVKAMEIAQEGLRNGDSVHIFPEMTRCPEGMHGTQPFQLLPFRMAHEGGIPIIPVVFVGTDQTWAKGSLKIRFRPRIQVRQLEPVLPGNFQNASQLRDEVQRRIEDELNQYGS